MLIVGAEKHHPLFGNKPEHTKIQNYKRTIKKDNCPLNLHDNEYKTAF